MGRRIAVVLGAIVIVGLALAGGYFYGVSVGQSRASQARQMLTQGGFQGRGDQMPGQGQTPPAGQRAGGRTGSGTMGTIESIEGDTLVIAGQQGTVRVKITETTLVEKLTSVPVSELETGEQVTVTGSRNDDGTITARSVQSLGIFQAARSGR